MREIKFRGKRTRDGKWICGHLMRIDTYFAITWSPFRWIDGAEMEGVGWDYVHTETVGQYTGLKDNNNKDIYEGDIITVDNGIGYSAIVYFGDGGFKRIPVGAGTANSDYLTHFYGPEDYEVIGNIHESPELLGGTE